MKYLTCITCLMLLALGAMAQEPETRWGKISDDQWELFQFPDDPDATALVLFDVGRVKFNTDGELEFHRHRRVKILDEAGYGWGTVFIAYLDDEERVKKIKGETYIRGADGKVEKHRLNRDDIFEEQVDGETRQQRFTLPALAPGAIIEYEYRIETDNPFLIPDWYFQLGEPVIWTDFEARIPNYITYAFAVRGEQRFAIREAKEIGGHSMEYRWAKRYVPALREEPFMTTPDDYRARLEAQLSGYFDPNRGMRSFITTWDELSEQLHDLDVFGKHIRPSRQVRRYAEPLVAGLDDPHARMVALYDHLRHEFTWDGTRTFYASEPARKVLEAQRGTSGDLVLTLIALLRAADVNAHPVLISTRANGKMQPVYPLLSQFDHVLAYVDLGDARYLLDPTDPLRPWDLLPEAALNELGWIVFEKDPGWLRIEEDAMHRRGVNVFARLDADGTLHGTFSFVDDEYSALDLRYRWHDYDDPETFVREVFLPESLHETVVLDSVRVSGYRDEDAVFRTDAHFSLPGYAQVAGDFIYLNPTLVQVLHENPLKNPNRTFPVDMAYRRGQFYRLQLQLPAGYVVEELPEDQRLMLPERKAHFQRRTQAQGTEILLQAQYAISDPIFPPLLYANLRSFFDEVIAAEAEPLVFRRGEEPVANDGE